MEIGVHLAVVGSETEADIISSLLGASGIRSGERAADVATYGGGFGGWREILVREDQLERARELVASDSRPTA
jgi:hypothetical protein